MECPKGMRNGPCGGVTAEGKCYVDESRKCIWNAIYERSFKTGRTSQLLEILPPLDWERAGTDTWGDVIRQIRKTGAGKFFGSLFSGSEAYRREVWDSVFKTIRQPEWWKGDSEYHSPAYSRPVSKLEEQLASGAFVLVTEVTPPLSASAVKLEENIRTVAPFVSAINYTDSSSARPRMSSLACSTLSARLGADPVFQVAARDTTRTGLQATVAGLNALGIKNILCVTGDNPRNGPTPVSNMNMNDLDSVQMLWILRRMRDEGIYLDGTKMKEAPQLFIGAAAAPGAMKPQLQAIRDQKKVHAGAQFFQTNIIFDTEKLEQWLEQMYRRDILGKVYILVGVTPMKSLKLAIHLNTKVPGVSVPTKYMKRMQDAGDNARDEGVLIALELIEKIKGLEGVSGIHLMTLGWEEVVERISAEMGK
jgi:methylenetetrahydrofolate reductase (NADPH)